MIEFKPDKIGVTIIEKSTSTSGKYTIFLGEHFNGKEQCYDVGSLNLLNGELTRRHYTQKWEAQDFWETFKSEMRQRGEYESDEPSGLTIIPPE